jgi:hypothetical protein
MKLLLSIGAVTLTLVFCSGNAASQQPRQAFMFHQAVFIFPDLYRCLDLLRLESLQPDAQTNRVHIDMSDPNQIELLNKYYGVAGWLRGFFTGMNFFDLSQNGDVAKLTTESEWMPWIYSYCRSHPTDTLPNAAYQLGQALSDTGEKNKN